MYIIIWVILSLQDFASNGVLCIGWYNLSLVGRKAKRGQIKRVYGYIYNINKQAVRGMELKRFIYEEVRRAINEIYQAPRNDYFELGLNAVSKKKKYAKRAWELIKDRYDYLGGCKSFEDMNGDNGFHDFLYGRYIWRLFLGDTPQDILAILVYKATPLGRKRVCSAAKDKEFAAILGADDLKKSNHVYGEVSGKSEKSFLKNKLTNWIPKEQVPNILNKQIDLEQDTEADKREEVIPYDADRHYYRSIGGEKHRKAMFGWPTMRKNVKI